MQRSSELPRDEVIALLTALVQINSINPSLVPGAPGESAIAAYVARWLEEAGLEVQSDEVAPGRPNVIGRVRGTPGGPTLLLNAHMDTVGVEGMSDPFSGTVAGDRLYGRGSFDMKGGLASVMLAARAVARAGNLGGEVIVSAVVDEEYASIGSEVVAAEVRADAAIVTEPTALDVCVAHKGFAWITVETTGKAAHGSRPDLGTDAIAHMGRVLVDLESYEQSLASRPAHPYLGEPSVHASLIEGGQELSSYPERCRLQVERRTIPGETRDAVAAEVDALLARRRQEDPSFTAVADLFFWREPFEASLDEPIVRQLQHEVSAIRGREPELVGQTGWMDSALFAAVGIPTVVFGPGGDGAHAVEEYSLISEVSAATQVLTQTALAFCR